MEQHIKQSGHLKAPGNWINDPNGFIYYKGKYHLFYQYFPYAPVWGTMHWGHAVSDDLVNWEHRGIALFPTKYGDMSGCFSGSAVEDEGKMVLFYTGVHYHETDPENIHLSAHDHFDSCQMMISSEDGIHFDNFNGKQVVIPPITDKKIGDKTHTRDPKVWKGKNGWYMVLGSQNEEGRGKLLFYQSRDLKNWSFVNDVSKGAGWGWMWECPDYFETDGGQVLLVSAMGLLKSGEKETNQSICFLVEFDEASCEMKLPDQYQFMDYGMDLYAPQTTLDKEGRRVMMAWVRMPKPVDAGWIGMFCAPRVIETKDGHIYFHMHPNIRKAYYREISSAAEASADGYMVCCSLRDGEGINIGGFLIFREGNCITTDRSAVFPYEAGAHFVSETPELKDGFHLCILVDSNLVEVFVNDGEYVISNAVYGLTREIICTGDVETALFAAEKG